MPRLEELALTWSLIFIVPLGACDPPVPAEPNDVDLAPIRRGFHCGEPSADVEACGALDGFASAGTIRDWPSGSDIQVWLGVDHCVSPTTSGSHAAYQLVYLREGAGSAPLGQILPARVLARSAVFASTQLDTSTMPDSAAALAAIARGESPDPATTGEIWRVIPESPDAYRSLVVAPSGVSVGDGDTTNGSWFLRSDGTHLYLVSASIQGGCASMLSRFRR